MKQINKQKNSNFLQNLAVFLAGTDSENKIIYILHTKRQNNIWKNLSSLGQEPTFKAKS